MKEMEAQRLTSSQGWENVNHSTTVSEFQQSGSANRCSRGLSRLQRQILGVAYAVNRHTQGGVAKVKCGATVPGYRVPTCDYQGLLDFRSPLAVYAIYHFAPDNGNSDYNFRRTKATEAAIAAVSRAVTRLCNRELLIYPSCQMAQGLTAIS